jgi:uncharacterized protein (TIGR02246 family)
VSNRRHRLFLVLTFWVFLAGLGRMASAQTPPALTDEEAIRKTAQTFVAAFNAADAKAIAAHFLPEGEFVAESGEVYQGAPAIEKAFTAYFQETTGVRLKIDVAAVRLVDASLAIEEGTNTLIPAGNEPSTQSRYQVVHMRRDGQWKIASSRSLERKPASAHEQLRQLAWMLGDWIDESPEADVEHHCRWSKDGNYLLAEFKVQIGTKIALSGVQRIGWDPVARQVRSWIFDSEGGFAEGLWTRAADGWVVKVTGTRADGALASATNSYRSTGPDCFVWASVDRVVGGETEPNVAVTIVRKPPQPRPQ